MSSGLENYIFLHDFFVALCNSANYNESVVNRLFILQSIMEENHAISDQRHTPSRSGMHT